MDKNKNLEDELEKLLESERRIEKQKQKQKQKEKEKRINLGVESYLNEMEKKKNYIAKVEKLIGQLPKAKIIKAIQADYNNKKISEDTYMETMKKLGERAIFQVRLQENKKYNSKEELEQELGIKIEGHKINEIKEKEQEK